MEGIFIILGRKQVFEKIFLNYKKIRGESNLASNIIINLALKNLTGANVKHVPSYGPVFICVAYTLTCVSRCN